MNVFIALKGTHFWFLIFIWVFAGQRCHFVVLSWLIETEISWKRIILLHKATRDLTDKPNRNRIEIGKTIQGRHQYFCGGHGTFLLRCLGKYVEFDCIGFWSLSFSSTYCTGHNLSFLWFTRTRWIILIVKGFWCLPWILHPIRFRLGLYVRSLLSTAWTIFIWVSPVKIAHNHETCFDTIELWIRQSSTVFAKLGLSLGQNVSSSKPQMYIMSCIKTVYGEAYVP